MKDRLPLVIALLYLSSSLITTNYAAEIEQFTAPNICPEGTEMRLLDRYMPSGRTRVTSPEQCHLRCFAVRQMEVVQMELSNESSIDGCSSLFCSCSSAVAAYLNLLPRRYTTCTNVTEDNQQVQIFQRTDRVWKQIPQPLLFYAMDAVSETTNLGLLNEGGTGRSRSGEWVNGAPHYDCPAVVEDGPALLRFIPSEKPFLRVVHNITRSTISSEFTCLLWFKKRVPTVAPLPFIDTGNYGEWWMWNFPGVGDLLYYYGNTNYILVAGQLSQTEWNSMAIVVAEPAVTAYLNGTLRSSFTVTPGTAQFGDRMHIGSRHWPGYPYDGVTHDGCLAHIWIFNKSLSAESLQKLSSAFMDKHF